MNEQLGVKVFFIGICLFGGYNWSESQTYSKQTTCWQDFKQPKRYYHCAACLAFDTPANHLLQFFSLKQSKHESQNRHLESVMIESQRAVASAQPMRNLCPLVLDWLILISNIILFVVLNREYTEVTGFFPILSLIKKPFIIVAILQAYCACIVFTMYSLVRGPLDDDRAALLRKVSFVAMALLVAQPIVAVSTCIKDDVVPLFQLTVPPIIIGGIMWIGFIRRMALDRRGPFASKLLPYPSPL